QIAHDKLYIVRLDESAGAHSGSEPHREIAGAGADLSHRRPFGNPDLVERQARRFFGVAFHALEPIGTRGAHDRRESTAADRMNATTLLRARVEHNGTQESCGGDAQQPVPIVTTRERPGAHAHRISIRPGLCPGPVTPARLPRWGPRHPGSVACGGPTALRRLAGALCAPSVIPPPYENKILVRRCIRVWWSRRRSRPRVCGN